MDLIYADETKKDIGIINSYDMDMAYGNSENNFTLKIDKSSHCCDKGYYIYVENEEYGGIVDAIDVDTSRDEITYSGRTWHGILEAKVIQPDSNADYKLVYGDAHTVLSDIISSIGLSDLFNVPQEDSGIMIYNYQFERYTYAYSGIKKMLKSAGAKLKVRWVDGYVELSAEYFNDYSQDEEFDTSQIDFEVERNFAPVNHIICLGQGELRDRAVIHLFTDENGGIQPYANTATPLQDSDYILTEENKIITGKDEIIEVYDYPNAAIAKNYIKLTSKPSDWETSCENYFWLDGNDKYKSVEKKEKGYCLLLVQPPDWTTNFNNYYNSSHEKVKGYTSWNVLTYKPGDWDGNYSSYCTKTGNNSYAKVEGVQTTVYTRQNTRPNDWGKNYANYYYWYSDGASINEYRSVSGVTKYTYTLQTSKPSDWSTNYDSYYRNATAKELKKNKSEKYKSVEVKVKTTYEKMTSKPSNWNTTFKNYYRSATAAELKAHPSDKYIKLSGNTAPTWVKNKYYRKVETSNIPKWKKNTYYTRYSEQVAPKWEYSGLFYTKTSLMTAPAWATNTYYQEVPNTAPTWNANSYYSYSSEKVAPQWASGVTYFREVTDRYADIVASAISIFEEYNKSDQLKIDLEETERVYDVGDLIGAIENTTEISITQEIVKKIIKITNDDISISYEVS